MFEFSGLIAINLDEGDELKWIRMTNGDNEVVISTAQGQAIRFHERDARPMGRVITWCYVVFGCGPATKSLAWILSKKSSSIFVISKYGYGKRTKVSQFTPMPAAELVFVRR